MTALPLTRLEARNVVNDYRVHVWPSHELDVDGLADVLSGVGERPAVGVDVACKALDQCADTLGLPPSPRELGDAVDFVLSDKARIRETIAQIREQLRRAS